MGTVDIEVYKSHLKKCSRDKTSLKSFVLATCATLFIAGCGGSSIGTVTPPSHPESQIPFASTQVWLTQFGTGTVPTTPSGGFHNPGDLMSALVPGPNGGVYAAGYTMGSFPGVLPNAIPAARPYVVLFGVDGKQQWLRQFYTDAGDFIDAAAVDSTGNLYLCGSTWGAFPGFSNPSGMSQVFVAKYDPNGNQSWVHQFAVAGQGAIVSAVALNPSGQLFIAGLQSSTTSRGWNIFIVSVDGTTGSPGWQQVYGKDSLDGVYGMAVDNRGGLYLSGDTSGAFPGNDSNDTVPFVAKLSEANGNVVWSQPLSDLSSTSHLLLASIAIAPDGNLIVGGAIAGNTNNDILVIGQGAGPTASALLLKLSADSGSISWRKTFSTGAGDQISAVSALADGTIYAAGSTNGVFSDHYSQPKQNLFLLKCDAAGNAKWVQQIGTGQIVDVSGIQYGAHLAVNTNGSVFMGAATQTPFLGYSNPSNAVEAFVAEFGQ
jgi:hypothetical protein